MKAAYNRGNKPINQSLRHCVRLTHIKVTVLTESDCCYLHMQFSVSTLSCYAALKV